jgi:hypothetical protein
MARLDRWGVAHRKLRERWAPIVATGTVRCARGADCFYADGRVGGFIAPGDPWDLGHDDVDRWAYRGPEHRRCNRATAGRRRFSRRW